MGWAEDKARVDVHNRQIRRLLSEVFVAEATEHQDAREATDLTVMHVRTGSVGVRVRTWPYFSGHDYATGEPYAHQFTIRCSRPRGTSTELEKILSGFGDFYFYGFEGHDGAELAAWRILDLDVFRRCLRAKEAHGSHCSNGDGSSSFRVFSLHQFPGELIRAQGIAGGLQWPDPYGVGPFPKPPFRIWDAREHQWIEIHAGRKVAL